MCKYLCADMPYFQRPRHSSKTFIHITAATDFESRSASKSYTTHSTHVNLLLLFLSKAYLHTTDEIHWSDIYIAVHNYSDSIIHYSLSLYIHSYTSVHSYIHSYAKFTVFHQKWLFHQILQLPNITAKYAAWLYIHNYVVILFAKSL